MKSLLKYFLPFSLSPLLLVSLSLFGQSKNEEVTIIAPYIPSIGNANKIPFRPQINTGEKDHPTFDYNYVTKKTETKAEPDPIEPVKYSGGQQEQLYRNFAKVGMGNYITPYLDFSAGSLQSEKYQFGVRLMHLSSQGKIKDYPVSAYSHNLVSVAGRAFTKTHTVTATVGYRRDVVHFYGFRPDSIPEFDFTDDDLRQRFQHVSGIVEFGSNYRQEYKINHKLSLGIHYFSDYYQTSESEISFMVGLDKEFKTSGTDFRHEFAVDLGLEYFGYKDTINSYNPLYIPIRPVYRFSFAQYRFEAGLKIEVATGTSPSGASSGIDVFPLLKAEVVVIEGRVKAFAEVTGNRTINSFRGLSDMNPFIISAPRMIYTDEQIRVGGGITGNVNGLNFTADAYYSYINDLPLFVTDTTLVPENKFEVIYDNINLLQVKASLGYVRIKELDMRLSAGYYHYIPKNEIEAWHMPDFELELDAGYTFKEKYTLRASALALGSKYAKTLQEGVIVPEKIKGAFDLGAGFEYRINRMVSAYVDVNNIFNQHYQRWYEYPVQGILVMAGAKLSF